MLVPCQLDVKTAFLNGYLSEEVYMFIHLCFSYTFDHVYLLCRATYGLKYSPHAWYKRFQDVLKIDF